MATVRIVLMMVLAVCSATVAGPPEVLWTSDLQTDHDSRIWDLTFTDEGGVLAVGSHGTPDEDLTTILIMKTDPQGDVLWSRSTGLGLSAVGRDVLPVPGGYLVCGSVLSSTGLDAFLAMFDYFGEMTWSRTYREPGDNVLHCMERVPGGEGVVCAGYTESMGAGGKDFWLVHLDEEGDVQWSRAYGTAGSEVAYSVQALSDGGYALCGGSDGNFHLVATDSEGNGSWAVSFDNGGHEIARCLLESDEGGFLLAGSTLEEGGHQMDIWLVRTDASGDESWTLVLGGEENDSAWDAVEPGTGGFVVLGNTMSAGAGSYDASLFRIDPWGNVIWEVLAGDSNWNTAAAMVRDGEEGYILGGRSWSPDFRAYMPWLVRTGPEDLLNWP